MKAIELLAVAMVAVFILGGLILANAAKAEPETARKEAGLRPVSLGQVGGGGIVVDILRFVDEEAGVVCWIAKALSKAGLSCVPLGDTLLDGKK